MPENRRSQGVIFWLTLYFPKLFYFIYSAVDSELLPC